jgi:hypothetical protein
VKRHNAHTRVHTLGIGYGPNEYFIRYIARASQALSDQVFPGEGMVQKATEMFRKILRGPLGTIRFIHNASVKIVPAHPLPFWGGVQTFWVRLNDPYFLPRHLFFKHQMNMGSSIWDIVIFQKKNADPGEERIPVEHVHAEHIPIPLMWAREYIRHVEN